jgi:hypothetical protein
MGILIKIPTFYDRESVVNGRPKFKMPIGKMHKDFQCKKSVENFVHLAQNKSCGSRVG